MPSRLTRFCRILQQDGAEHDAEDRALAAAQREAAEHRRGDGVELVEIAVRRPARSSACTWRRRSPTAPASAAADDVGGDDDAAGADARIARRLLVLADGVEIAAEHRAVQHHRPSRWRRARKHDEGLSGTPTACGRSVSHSRSGSSGRTRSRRCRRWCRSARRRDRSAGRTASRRRAAACSLVISKPWTSAHHDAAQHDDEHGEPPGARC